VWQGASAEADKLKARCAKPELPSMKDDVEPALKAYTDAQAATSTAFKDGQRPEAVRTAQAQAATALRAALEKAAERLIQASEKELAGCVARQVEAFFRTNSQVFRNGGYEAALRAACGGYSPAPGNLPDPNRFSNGLSCCDSTDQLQLRSDLLAQLRKRAEAAKQGATQQGFVQKVRAEIARQIPVAVEFAKKLDGIVDRVLGPANALWAPGKTAQDQKERKGTVGKAFSDLAEAEKAAPKSALHGLILSAKAEQINTHYKGSLGGNYGLDDANLQAALHDAFRGRNRDDSPMAFGVQDYLVGQLDIRAKQPKPKVPGKEPPIVPKAKEQPDDLRAMLRAAITELLQTGKLENNDARAKAIENAVKDDSLLNALKAVVALGAIDKTKPLVRTQVAAPKARMTDMLEAAGFDRAFADRCGPLKQEFVRLNPKDYVTKQPDGDLWIQHPGKRYAMPRPALWHALDCLASAENAAANLQGDEQNLLKALCALERVRLQKRLVVDNQDWPVAQEHQNHRGALNDELKKSALALEKWEKDASTKGFAEFLGEVRELVRKPTYKWYAKITTDLPDKISNLLEAFPAPVYKEAYKPQGEAFWVAWLGPFSSKAKPDKKEELQRDDWFCRLNKALGNAGLKNIVWDTNAPSTEPEGTRRGNR